MPTYDYECQKCGVRIECFHGMNETPVVTCPECGGGTKKLIGMGTGIIFKGSGFYETDYKRKEHKDTKTQESTTSSEGASKKPDTAGEKTSKVEGGSKE